MMKGLASIPRVCALLPVLCVGVYVYLFFETITFGREPQPQLFKNSDEYSNTNTTSQLRHWPFLGVNPLLMETRNETKCDLPQLKVANKDVLPFYHPHGPIDCPKLFNTGTNKTKYAGVVAFTVKNGRDLHQLVHMSLSCCYQPFVTVDPGEGFTKHWSRCVAIWNDVTVIPSGIDYIEVLCRDDKVNKQQILYRDGFPLVHPPPMLKNRTRVNNTSRLNIMVIGLDSTSQLNFQRFMPLSSKYLLSSPDMSVITLHGYSVVDSGTRYNVFPMLSGLSRHKMEQKCYDRNRNWNNCSKFIWEQASKRGYITNYAEDWQFFQWFYSHSFKKPPTDYYFWPFAVKMKTFGKLSQHPYYCLGTRLGLQVLLKFAQSVSEVAQKENRPHFQFIWSGELAHNPALNSISLGDDHLLDALKKFNETGIVNNTVIMIIGDHGSDQSDYFRTPSGRVEYRLPVAHIILPPWFKTKYPREHNNLVRNSYAAEEHFIWQAAGLWN